MINRIYVTSEELNLVEEILEKNKMKKSEIEENVLKTLVFCKYYDLEFKSEIISNFKYEFNEIVYEFNEINESLIFIDDESYDYFDALDDYYNEILVNELYKSKIVISARMHALILGLTYECDIITYKISDKLKAFDEMFGKEFHLNSVQTNIKTIIKDVLND